jgi:hypothetical protein
MSALPHHDPSGDADLVNAPLDAETVPANWGTPIPSMSQLVAKQVKLMSEQSHPAAPLRAPEQSLMWIVRAWGMINALRKGDGSTVTIEDDHPSPTKPGRTAITCCGAWTEWSEARFEGADLLEALEAATRARAAA